MGWRKTLIGALLSGGLAMLAGCGAGQQSAFVDFFGSGTTTTTSATTENRGVVQGVILRRVRDGRVLIVASAADVNEPTTPVVGATVSIVELSLAGLTGATGNYQFTEVTPGDLTLRITLPQNLGGTSASFSLRLDPGETISGLPAGVNS